MLKNYIKIALRNLWKHKIHTLINVLGLALGIASSIILFFIVQYELSFDNFHPKADRIYRITSSSEHEGKTYYSNTVPKPLPEAFQQDFAGDVEDLLVLETTYKQLVKLNGQTTSIQEPVAFTQNEYFSFLNVPLKAGNPQTILRRPNEVVLSEALSNKLFGSVDQALGQVFTFTDADSSYQLEVTGVMQNPPQNTDFDFEMLISYNTKEKVGEEYWNMWNSAFNVFVLLPKHTDPDALSIRLGPFLRKYVGDEEVEKSKTSLLLQSLRELHYDDRYHDFGRKMSEDTLAGLIFLAVLLVLMACINFVNLATAISTKRTKEVGIRKTLGSSRKQIIFHFLGEALVVTLVASVLALGLAELGLMQLKRWYDYLNPVIIQFGWSSVAFLLLLVLLVTNIAGFYPGWLLSRFKPIQMFRASGVVTRRHRFSLRQGLVVFQFFISQVFIVCTLIISQQLNFLENAPLGFNEQAIITVDLKDKVPQNIARFKTMLNGTTGIEDMTFSAFSAISQSMYGGIYEVEGVETEKQVDLQFADEHFFDTHDMSLLAGKVFTPSDSGSGFVVNEAFVHDLGLQQPEQALGKYIAVWGFDLPIVGVVADYHTSDFRQKISPLVITNASSQYGSLSLKVDMAQAASIISRLEEIWKLTYPEYDFSYAFLDDQVAGFYQEYEQNFSLAQVFAGIAIFIGCLGLYGLVMFMAESKTKEIGIRKVLGASVRHILGFFSKEFVKLILIAFVLAVPLAYFAMQYWLQDFAYKIEIGLAVFTAGLLFTLTLVLLTVGYQSIKAALANPVDSLRNE